MHVCLQTEINLFAQTESFTKFENGLKCGSEKCDSFLVSYLFESSFEVSDALLVHPSHVVIGTEGDELMMVIRFGDLVCRF